MTHVVRNDKASFELTFMDLLAQVNKQSLSTLIGGVMVQ